MIAVPSHQTKTARTLTRKKAAWLEDRRTYLGATDIGSILGLNPYSSPHDTWLDKRGERAVDETIPMRAGTFMEPFIASEWERKTGLAVKESRTYRHPLFAFLACNPDRETEVDGRWALLECKRVGYWAKANFGQDGSDQIPEHYLAQILWQLIVTGADLVVLAALIDDRELREFRYTLKPELSESCHVFPQDDARRMFNFAIRWWRRHIEQGEEPSLDHHASDDSWVKRERASYENGQLTNTDEVTDRECQLLQIAVRRLDRATKAVDGRKNRIKAFMATRGASELESTVGTFRWKLNVKGVAAFTTPFATNKA